MMGIAMLNEENMHVRVGNVKGQSQELHQAWEFQYGARPTLGNQRGSGVKIPGGNWSLATKDLDKEKKDK